MAKNVLWYLGSSIDNRNFSTIIPNKHLAAIWIPGESCDERPLVVVGDAQPVGLSAFFKVKFQHNNKAFAENQTHQHVHTLDGWAWTDYLLMTILFTR